MVDDTYAFSKGGWLKRFSIKRVDALQRHDFTDVRLAYRDKFAKGEDVLVLRLLCVLAFYVTKSPTNGLDTTYAHDSDI